MKAVVAMQRTYYPSDRFYGMELAATLRTNYKAEAIRLIS